MASTGDAAKWRLGRRPALDGLRGIAILLVLGGHVEIPGAHAAGAVGVAVFFTLSGFLITSLLLEERARRGRVHLRGFYARRARRLVPALLLSLAVWLVIDLVVHGRFTETPLVLGALTYTGNLVMSSGRYDLTGAALGHTWSLAIEEQFYLLWPVLLLGLRRFPRGVAIVVLVGASTGSLLLRDVAWLAGRGGDLGYYGTLQRMDGLLIGCALALLFHGGQVPRAPQWLLPAGGLVVAGLTAADGALLYVWLPTLVSLATIGILWAGCTRDAPVLTVPWLRWLGARSYGLYLLHHVLIFTVHQLAPGWSWWLVGLVMVPISLLAAEASWRLVERRWLRHPEPGLQPERRERRRIDCARQKGAAPGKAVVAQP